LSFVTVGEGFAEQIAFTKALVGFPSVRGAEHTIQDFVVVPDSY
jgi:acetylornithine deacetylase